MTSSEERIVKELEDIKRLLILAMVHAGVPQNKVAAALGVNKSTISRLLSPEKEPSQRRG